MWPDHVGALNLVEIEFHDHPAVIEKWRKLYEHLGTPHQKRSDEEIRETMPEHEKRERTNRYWLRLGQERHEILAALLHAIGKVSGFSKMEQLEIFKGGYTPQGWTDVEFEQTAVRRLFAEIYLGIECSPSVFFTFQDSKNRNRQNLRFRIPTRRPSEGPISRRMAFTIAFPSVAENCILLRYKPLNLVGEG